LVVRIRSFVAISVQAKVVFILDPLKIFSNNVSLTKYHFWSQRVLSRRNSFIEKWFRWFRCFQISRSHI